MTDTTRVVRTTLAGTVATVTFDRPPVNALNRQALRELAEEFEALADLRVSVAVLRTGGTRAFIAGADLKEIDEEREVGPGEAVDRGALARRALEAVAGCAVPVVAVVDGAAIGGGLSFAALADIVVADETARFGTTEINVGLLGASAHLRRLVGGVRAREMYLTGRLVEARELAAWGAIAHAVPAAELEATVTTVVHGLAAKSPLALRLAKQALDRTEFLPVHEGYRVEQDYTNRLLGLRDSAEARRAFLERRDPEWTWS
ncbi:enoyl-CoA hydratase-related protein [Pseudonocardia sp. NPDC049154]|uniref:enoyl-CoA hydratase-related protein n=1 Tax=Pseudonocardia sp. NPDC049154 TaxID=3155501 RepID=UPI0033C2CBA0